ncbi:hypothetical protein [Oceanirhabdus sp. W0125-5]|uniref:hypothetical protein n=1 Tax=Oceanirhabdus sp. W0125-5 TaxID=2999116 RepID=UPI0022F3373B|nr:hypothetical protein [Oceanirhabdus sp. W0125-5]WBW96713.1 hypothetical protein OW730_23915 [Oceanirhabdus sp. W0125-5]
MGTNCFTFKLRTQFSFIVDDCTLSHILDCIAKKGINITGYFQTKLFDPNNKCHPKFDLNLVRLVVGSTDCESNKDLLGVKEVLCYHCVDFEEKYVIQVVNITPGTPGLFSSINKALLCNVTINALYEGEESEFFIDVSDICKALKILSKPPVKHCEKDCCSCCSDD